MKYLGPKSSELCSSIASLGVMETRPFAIDLEKSHGMYLKTVEGKDIFDWAGFYGSKLIGHNHSCYFDPEFQKRLLVAARNKVANPDFVTQELTDYYKFLHSVAPKCMTGDLRVYTLNSGAEAIENALKFCLYKYYKAGKTQTPKFVCFDRAFHGRTLYTLNLTDMPYDKDAMAPFSSVLPEPLRLYFPDATLKENPVYAPYKTVLQTLSITLSNFKDSIAGIILEPLQGAGGNRTAPQEFFQELSYLAHSCDIPLIFDEVQTAGGQTGTLWMCDSFGLNYSPMCVVTAKKFGCGVVYMNEPLSEEVLDSTWSGSLVDMVRVTQEFKTVFDNGLLEKVPYKSSYFEKGLNKLVKDFPLTLKAVNGVGLYLGMSFHKQEDRDSLVAKLLSNYSTLVLKAGNFSIRMRPPLTVSAIDIAMLLHKLRSALEDGL